MSSEIKVDTISEKTAANGVTIDGVNLKDSVVKTDTINEKTSAAGVTIDGVLIKDSKIPGSAGGGLVYINSGTFSSASTLTVSSVFSSTYENYKIIIEITDNSADDCGTTFRLYDGSEITANYISQRFQGEDSTAEVGKSPDGTDEWTCVPIDQTYAYGGFIQVLLNSPNEATATHFSLQGDGTYGTNTLYSTANSGVHTGTDQATGFAYKVSSGTFDGNWVVYGFAKS